MDGFINLYKPPGISSHQAVQMVRNSLKVKVGHAGTLDPAASGVLPLCIGKATRLAEVIMEFPKTYMAEMVFGKRTKTGDAWGEVVSCQENPPVSRVELEAALEKFRGYIWQVPPMYAALSYQGKKLYRWAREGKEVPREPRKVFISELKVTEADFSLPFPRVSLLVTCSRGTYVRVLCADLGEYLGCGAYLAGLLRTRVGKFQIEEALSPEEVNKRQKKGELTFLYSLDYVLEDYPRAVIKEEAEEKVRVGKSLTLGDLEFWEGGGSSKSLVCLYAPDKQLLALALWEGNYLKLKKVFVS